MTAWRRLLRRRPYALALAATLVLLLAGDKAQLAPPPGTGIDPFEVLDQQVRNNVLIVLDTSGSMKWPVDRDNFTLGADDPASRMHQAKQAIKAVVSANQDKVNFGLVTYNALPTDKTINQTQNYEGDARVDGPFVYVTADGAAAQPFHTLTYTSNDDPATGESEAFTGRGFFSRISNTFANYDGTNSSDVWRSFMNRDGGTQQFAYSYAYPNGCSNTTGQLTPLNLTNPGTMRCRYYMQSRLLRNGVKYTWNRGTSTISSRLTATNAITCPAPPAGLLGHSFPAPCFQIEDAASSAVATYYYTSSIYQQQVGSSCGGGALLADVAPCHENNASEVLAQMDPELPITPAGQLSGVPTPPGNATFDYGDGHLDGDQTPAVGLRADQATPLAGTLDYIRTVTNPMPAFPAQAVRSQKNFVILVTDGDDTCADGNPDRAAVIAAKAAENLYRNFDPVSGSGDFRHWAETLVVGFASAVNPARINVIAQGGSGAIIDGSSSNPSTAATCPPGVTCRNAFFASSTQELVDILNAALEQAASSGIFSETSSVFDGVPEYVNTVPASPFPPAPPASPFPYDVMDPDSRYRAQPFRSYRALFDVNGFKGIVRGFDEFGPMTGPAARPCPDPPARRPSRATGVTGKRDRGCWIPTASLPTWRPRTTRSRNCWERPRRRCPPEAGSAPTSSGGSSRRGATAAAWGPRTTRAATPCARAAAASICGRRTRPWCPPTTRLRASWTSGSSASPTAPRCCWPTCRRRRSRPASGPTCPRPVPTTPWRPPGGRRAR